MDKTRTWSVTLQGETRDLLDSGIEGCFLKHIDGRFGILNRLDKGYAVIDRDSDAISFFDTTDALIADGWAAD